jgi:WD40 repeat protein
MISAGKTFRVFVSSTFMDLVDERNALHTTVFPELEKLCRQNGCLFQAIDLRWGISEADAYDQRTVKICLEEIERCQEMTPRPNFLILMGDRYGWRPLPFEIPLQEFEQLLTQITRIENASFLKEWYIQDHNSLASAYFLRSRVGEEQNQEIWSGIEEKLHAILRNASPGLDLPEEEQLKYDASATELETWKGVFQVADAGEHVFGFLRHITLPNGQPLAGELPNHPAVAKYLDIDDAGGTPGVDRTAAQRLAKLKGNLHQCLGKHVFDYNARWQGDGITQDHLPALCDDVYRVLANIILAQIKNAVTFDALAEEKSTQRKFHQERTLVFVGRASERRAIANYLAKENRAPFVILAPSGAGKSALLAQVVEDARGQYPQALIIERFVGISPACSNTRELLEGIILEISRYFGLGDASVPANEAVLKRVFASRLEVANPQQPVMLVIDGVDQLSDLGEKELTWLPKTLPDHVHLVISATQTGTIAAWLTTSLPPSAILELERMSLDEGRQLLLGWLTQTGRTLQKSQMEAALASFDNSRLPLHLWLIFQEVRRWKSDFTTNTLPASIESLLGDFIHRLVLEHGEKLVGRSLGALAAAQGLTEDELMDILSSDKEVLSNFLARARHPLPQPRLPFVVWSRLRANLGEYINYRSVDNTPLLVFAQKQVETAVIAEFLPGAELQKTHARLAGYFASQPLMFGAVPNLRKLRVMPRHQCLAGLPAAAQATLTDLDFLEAKVTHLDVTPNPGRSTSYRGVFALQDDLRLAIKAYTKDYVNAGMCEPLKALLSCLTAQSRHIEMWPAAIFSQLTWEARRSRLAPPDLRRVAGSGKERSENGAAIRLDPYVFIDGSRLAHPLTPGLMQATCCTVIGEANLVATTCQTPELVVTHLETGDEVFNIAVEPAFVCTYLPASPPCLVVGGMNGVLYFVDLERGCVVSETRVHSSEIMGLSASCQGRYLAACGSRDRSVIVLDQRTGKSYAEEEDYFHSFNDCAFSPTEDLLAVASTRGAVSLHRVPEGTWDAVYSHQADADVCLFSPSGSFLASGGHTGDLVVWDLANHCEIWRKGPTGSSIPALAFLNDAVLFTGDGDGFIDEYDVRTGKLIRRITQLPGSVFRLGVDRSRQRLLAAANGLWVIDPMFPDAGITTFPAMIRGSVMAVAQLKDGSVAVGGSGPALSVISGGFDSAAEQHVIEQQGMVSIVRAAPGGKKIIAGWASTAKDTLGGRVEIRDVDTNGVKVIEPGGLSNNFKTAIFDLCYLPGEQILVGAFSSPELRTDAVNQLAYWDLNSGKKSILACEAGQGPYSITWDPEQKRIIAGHADGTVRFYQYSDKLQLWHRKTFVEANRFRLHEDGIWSCLYAPTFGGLITAGADGYIKVSNLENGKLVRILHRDKNPVVSCSLRGDGSLLASASSGGEIRFWQAKQEQAMALFFTGTFINSISFSANGKDLFFGGGRCLVGAIRISSGW